VRSRSGRVHASRGRVHARSGRFHASRGRVHARSGHVRPRSERLHASRGHVHPRSERVHTSRGRVHARSGRVRSSRERVNASRGHLHARSERLRPRCERKSRVEGPGPRRVRTRSGDKRTRSHGEGALPLELPRGPSRRYAGPCARDGLHGSPGSPYPSRFRAEVRSSRARPRAMQAHRARPTRRSSTVRPYAPIRPPFTAATHAVRAKGLLARLRSAPPPTDPRCAARRSSAVARGARGTA
jgi:hypothetical protein